MTLCFALGQMFDMQIDDVFHQRLSARQALRTVFQDQALDHGLGDSLFWLF